MCEPNSRFTRSLVKLRDTYHGDINEEDILAFRDTRFCGPGGL